MSDDLTPRNIGKPALYLIAALAPVLVGVLQYYLWQFVAPFAWFLFFPTVFFAARLGGLRTALIAALSSSLIVWFVFLTPHFSWEVTNPHNLLTLAVFLLMAYLLGDSQETLIKARQSLHASLDSSALQNLEISRLYQQNLALDDLKFSHLADALPQIVWATTPAGQSLFFNRNWYDYTGLSPAGCEGDAWTCAIHPDDVALVRAAWRKAIEETTAYTVECRLRRADGVYRWWQIRGVPAFNLAHQVDKWFATCADIDSIKQDAADLAAEKSKLQSIFDNSPDGMAILGVDESFVDYNQKYLSYFGLDEASQLPPTYTELMSLFDVATVNGKAVNRTGFPGVLAVSGEPVFSKELHLKSTISGRKWYGSHSAMPIRDHQGAISGAVLSVRDITLNIEDKIRLINTVREQDTILNSGIAGIAKTKDRQFVWVNQRFNDNFGYETGELLGQSSQILYPDASAFEAFGKTIDGIKLQEKTLINEAIQLQRKDGSLGWFLVGGGPVSLGSDESIWLSIDVTQDRKNQDLLEAYAKRLEKSMEDTLLILSKALDMRDPYTAGHQQRVGLLSEAIGKKLNLSTIQCHNLKLIGWIHDIGKIAIPLEILSKPAKLSDIEYELVKAHVNIGYEILKGADFLAPVAEVVHEHHERMDGSGYPMGLKGEQILLEAKIIAVADVVESMSTHRPYRPALGLDVAMAEIEANRGSKYDPVVVDACLSLFRDDGFQMPQAGGDLLAHR